MNSHSSHREDDQRRSEEESPRPEKPGIRCFLALDLSPEVRNAIAGLLQRLQKGAVFTGANPVWTKAESIHLTLHFMGNVPLEDIEAMKPEFDAVAANIAIPPLSVKMLGCFPNEFAPKVLWIGISRPGVQLLELHRRLIPILRRRKIEVDSRPYQPHLTLARIKSSRGVKGLMDVVESHRRYEMGSFQPAEMILFKSELQPTGAVYTPLHRSKFAAGEDEE